MNLTHKQPFGEIIASSLIRCTLQAWEWDSYPAAGTFIIIEEEQGSKSALIDTIVTTPLESSRLPTTYKKDLATLKAEHPHIFLLLRTTIECIPLECSATQRAIPNRPAKLHTFCREATQHEITQLTQQSSYIKKVLTYKEPAAADSLIETHLHYLAAQHSLTPPFLQMLIKEYIAFVGSDYKRILNFNALLQNVRVS
jgi:hypothetical protein